MDATAACHHRRADLAPGVAFCGACGAPIGRRSYRGPRWLAIAGALLALLGGLVAVAAFSTVQANGVPALAADILAPTVNQTLDAAGVGQIDVPSSGDGASLAIVLAFLAGAATGTLGLLVLAVAAVWATVRYKPQRRREELQQRAQPVAADLARLSRSAASTAAQAGQAGARRGRAAYTRRAAARRGTPPDA